VSDSDSLFPVCAGIVAVVGAVFLYWLPTIIAWRRDHSNTFSIGVTNLFFGWTIIGWLFALIWATTDNVRRYGRYADSNSLR
jgi:uncharacterized membrane protein